MRLLTYFNYFLWFFGHFKVRLIGLVRPKIIHLDENTVIVRLPLNRRTRNHLNSMYFGALAIGADLAGGLPSFYHSKQLKIPMAMAFKGFEASFLKRPDTAVYFCCNQGQIIKKMILESQQTLQRINQWIEVDGVINWPQKPEKIAAFRLELSIKAQA